WGLTEGGDIYLFICLFVWICMPSYLLKDSGRNAVGKKKVPCGGSNRKEEAELGGSKGEVIPEVEALLARLRAL
uniref:Uncharacterized protein n=1 Tax=Naja naja TaxID=35670 RepID=A0A8C6Y339_NAJNA